MLFGQAEDEVLIREPGTRRYSPPVHASTTATPSWEYAVLSGNSYLNYWPGLEDPAPWEVKKGKFPQEEYWEEWKDFSKDKALSTAANYVGLYGEVWEKKSSSPRTIVVVFRGTDASWKDWRSNLRWILRIIPFYSLMKDQYTVVADKFANTFLDHLTKKMRGTSGGEYTEVKIIAAGHSLGGGLAQHFAYALPGRILSDGSKMPRVSEVYSFDPSPVTGWFSVKDIDQRTTNVSSLKIDRAF
ncbi:MAG: lipase family protein, partial [Nitrospirales bacterium]